MAKHSRRANSHRSSFLERIARTVTEWTGSSGAFALAVLIILIWGATGPIFGFSDTWQLVINTGTTIVTFLMVFLIQRAQNKDALAIHLKLNEIVAAVQGASNRLINVEDLTEEEIRVLHEHYRQLATLAKHEGTLTQSHSIEEAATRARLKRRHRPAPAPGAAPAETPGGTPPSPPE
jgi:low affinity Fe/Cu permease